jgi:hypothetical protein
VYYNQSNAHDAINQGCYKLSTFWSQLDVCLPRWRTDKDLEGFQGFCHNPAAKYAKLQHLQKQLARDVMRSGQRELEILLEAKPLVSDDDDFAGIDENDGDTWQRAAW